MEVSGKGKRLSGEKGRTRLPKDYGMILNYYTY